MTAETARTGATQHGIATPRVPSAGRMSGPEPLIARWDLEAWMNPVYRVPGGDPAKASVPVLESRYRGLVRVVAKPKTITVVGGVPVTAKPNAGEEVN